MDELVEKYKNHDIMYNGYGHYVKVKRRKRWFYNPDPAKAIERCRKEVDEFA